MKQSARPGTWSQSSQSPQVMAVATGRRGEPPTIMPITVYAPDCLNSAGLSQPSPSPQMPLLPRSCGTVSPGCLTCVPG
jgi:hypothetical protein